MAREFDEVALRFQAKAELRARLKGVRRALPAEARRERSLRVATRVSSLDAWANARTILAYVAMAGETDPAPLVESLLGRFASVDGTAEPVVDLARNLSVL